MGLLKAADAEYLVLEEEPTPYYGEFDEDASYDGDTEYEFAAPVIIGSEGLLDLVPWEGESLDDLVFFAGAETEVVFGDAVMVGGSYQRAQEETYEETYDDYAQPDYESYEEPSYEDEYALEPEEEVDPDAPPAALKD